MLITVSHAGYIKRTAADTTASVARRQGAHWRRTKKKISSSIFLSLRRTATFCCSHRRAAFIAEVYELRKRRRHIAQSDFQPGENSRKMKSLLRWSRAQPGRSGPVRLHGHKERHSEEIGADGISNPRSTAYCSHLDGKDEPDRGETHPT